ncbi:MAG: geranylgeranyl reductase family protein [Vicinamibacterales bacterium]
MRDVVVIGAGPAGSITAQLLAAAGRDVVVLEEHDGAGTPVHCTGLLGFDAFEEFDLPRDLILGRADAARFWGAAGRSVLVHSERVEAAVIDRARLDRTLAERAASSGADVRLGCRAESIAVGPRGVSVVARGLDEPIEARACVLACGASYRFHRQLGLGLPQVFLQSAQLETVWPNVPQIEVRFGQTVAPSGFAWLVPLQRDGVPHARIGMMATQQSRDRFHAFLGWLAAEAGLDAAALPPPNFKMLPLGPVSRTYGDRVVAVGDAAGLVKPTTGGGIFYGLVSGALAAQVLDAALDRDRLGAAELRRYESAWRKRLGQEIRVGLAFRRIAARLSDESIDDLIELARVNGVVPLLQQTASFNWHRKAAIALLGHPAFRKIVFKSVVRDGAFL